MRIITKRTLREFWERHPDARQPLLDWYNVIERADWEAPRRVRERYPSASIITGNRVVFNIKGNTYRLVVKVNYAYRMVYIRFIGTHAEYNAIDAGEV
ncbi:MAG: type II toxin-antitoxin system HigB family toxin [Chloroflexi bacterium]|nr:type II toxin-antitoxin system HigB family toxin [Chloroflexota bacterium]